MVNKLQWLVILTFATISSHAFLQKIVAKITTVAEVQKKPHILKMVVDTCTSSLQKQFIKDHEEVGRGFRFDIYSANSIFVRHNSGN